MIISEYFLQYLWKYKFYKQEDLQTVCGEKIKVIRTGEHNQNAGADFLNAQIKINENLWAGNVEIHINSSDWIKHKHSENKDYDNVILHVVLNNDAEIQRNNKQIIPTLVLEIPKNIEENYIKLISKKKEIACSDNIKNVDEFIFHTWQNRLLIERLEEKSQRILQNLNYNKNSWTETFYQQLAYNFGFKLNSLPFELLAKSLSTTILAKHKNNLFQIEAMLFGQAGFLEKPEGDEYYLSLKKEYNFLKNKFDLKPIENHLWKFLRLRPVNFPTIRIAQFAVLIHKSSSLFSRILEIDKISDLEKLFDISTSEYWKTHYNFNKESKKRIKNFGKISFHNLIINTIVPFCFVYGKIRGKNEIQNKALEWLEQTPAENNSIIKKWNSINIKTPSAFVSQALLQLFNNYCKKNNCLNCVIGNKIVSQS